MRHMIAKIRQRLRAGKPYDGPAAWCDDYTLVPRPGYYALTADGKRVLPDVPLVCVDDAPGDPENGACHYEYGALKEYPQRKRVVAMEAESIHGRAEVVG